MTNFFANIDWLTILNGFCILGIIVGGVLTASMKKPLSCVLALGGCGAFVALEFILLHAPDVAIAEASVGCVLSTILFVIALRKDTKEEEK